MTDLNCGECGGSGKLGWIDTPDGLQFVDSCPVCNPPREKPKRQKARSPLRRQSPKRKQIEATHAPLREALKEAIGYCDVCGTKRTKEHLEEHHIGRQRHNEIDNLRRCMYVCRSYLKNCHDHADSLTELEQIDLVAKAMVRAVERCKGRVIH